MRKRGRPPHPDILTPREWEVLELLDRGLTNEEIARRLNISFEGAKFHVAQILSKLGVSSRHEAAAVAYGHRRLPLRRLVLAPFGWALGLSKLAKLVGAGTLATAVAAFVVFVVLVLAKSPAKKVFDMYPGLYVLDVRSGQVQRVADLRGLNPVRFEWSDDGRTLRLVHYLSKEQEAHIRALDVKTGAVLSDEQTHQAEAVTPSPPPGRWPSPDGLQYAAANFDTGTLDIRSSLSNDLVSSMPGALQFSAGLWWSPDSRWIATLRVPRRVGEEAQILIFLTDGSTPGRIVASAGSYEDFIYGIDSVIDWSPDSRALTYTYRGQIWQVEVLSGKSREIFSSGLGNLAQPRWSPDGSKIAFRATGETGIYIANADGTEARYLAPGFNVKLAPDGKRVAFDGYTMDVDGTDIIGIDHQRGINSDVAPLCGSWFAQSWSPDSQYLAIQDGAYGAEIVIAPGGKVGHSLRIGVGYSPVWSKDGSLLSYMTWDRSPLPTDNGPCTTHVVQRDGTPVASIPGQAMQWFSGNRLLVSQYDSGVAVLDSAGKVIRRLPPSATLSPKEDLVATREFFRTEDPDEPGHTSPDSRLNLLDANGATLRVFEHATLEGFSPDGTLMAYGVRQPFHPDETLFIVELKTPDATSREVATGRDFGQAVWSPNSKKLALIERTEDGQSKLDVLDVRTLTLKTIADKAGNPQWFPDGKHILYQGP